VKTRIDDLALFGGPAAFSDNLFVGRPNIGDRGRFFELVGEAFDRRWLTNDGPIVREFERRLTALTGAKHCLAICNGTIALEVAIRAAGLSGEVIVPAMTFVATAHALHWLGLTPVFCDVDPETHNLDPRRVEEAITPRTSAILGVHLWGRPCDVGALESIARHHGLTLLFDAAHAFGCSHDGRMIGNFGDAEIFSFHATKFFNTFEGGAVATNDDRLAEQIRLSRNFGFSGFDNVLSGGTNGKMSEISAAMGVAGLESLNEFIVTNEANFACYGTELAGIRGVRLLAFDGAERNNYQYIVVSVDEDEAGISRDRLVEILHAERVIARRYFFPGCHRMSPYQMLFPNAGERLPVTERIVTQLMCLPTGTGVTLDDIRLICSLIRFVVEHSRDVCLQLDSKTLV
jgi:dTDP-4-amino-4,6-dideoxygalactose transaminase